MGGKQLENSIGKKQENNGREAGKQYRKEAEERSRRTNRGRADGQMQEKQPDRSRKRVKGKNQTCTG